MFSQMMKLSIGLIFCALTCCPAIAQTSSLASAQTGDWTKVMIGNWKCDVENTIALFAESRVSAEEKQVLKSSLAGISLEITEQGAMNMSVENAAGKNENKATYEITESNKESMVVKLKVEMEMIPGVEKSGELTILNDNSIKLETDDSTAFIFERVKNDGR